MCGIFGVIANNDNEKDQIFDGLRRLEYRGYDSSGIATINNDQINCIKSQGNLDQLQKKLINEDLLGNVGIGHTRWATHGVPSTKNSHPHSSGIISIVHNGIIENYDELKSKLKKQRYKFLSDTDSEVIAHLIHSFLSKKKTYFDAVIAALKTLKGSYALGILNEKVIAAHCNVVEDGDLELLAESKAFPVFCPTTHGIAGKPMNTNFLSELNIDWGIGTDCSGGNDDYDMLEEMRTALVLNNSVAKKNFIKPKEVFRKASEENIKRISGGVFSGKLSKNQKADFITVLINTPRMLPLHDVVNNIVMCASSKEINDVYIDGKCVLKNSKFKIWAR